jgi:hypothetical protein
VTLKKNEDEFLNVAVYANVRRWRNSVLLAICDSELLGKVLRDGKIVFDVREEFYKGMKMSVEEAVDLIAQSTIVNMIPRCYFEDIRHTPCANRKNVSPRELLTYLSQLNLSL